MQRKFSHLAAVLLLVAGCVCSCVGVNEELGKEYIPTRHLYDVYTDTIFLKDIKMKQTDVLSGYSSSRITIGSVMDSEFGLTMRGSAFPLIPVDPDMDFGENAVCTQFHFTAVRDTLSWPDDNQEHIIQNVNVYKLQRAIGEDDSYISTDYQDLIGDTPERIAPVFSYFGQDSLSFNFDTSFGQEYIDKLQTMELDSVSNYVKDLPGIFIVTDGQPANGGRINMFELAIQVSDSYYISGNYAELKFRADYGERTQVDTSFLFFFGAQDMSVYQEATSYYSSPTQTPQYALNMATSEGRYQDGTADDIVYVEGGVGVKPVISSQEIRDGLLQVFADVDIDPSGVIINKATVVLPYDYDDSRYEQMFLMPDRLSPTCRISSVSTDEESGDETVYYTFAGLTDSSVESENQGDINRSLNRYCPDISHHVQEILRLGDEDDYADYDVWLLTMANETVESSSSSSSALSDYYQNLAYYNYYNNMYNYGYGSYYGYGGYNSYYGMSNYYNYLMAAQYASSSSTTVSVVTQLDTHRYYRGILRGPGADTSTNKDLPMLVVTYSVPRASGE